MRVEQEGTGFAPITITIETQEEANLMWAKLNTAPCDIADHSRGVISNMPDSGLHATNQQMWKTFDAVYQIHR